MNVSLELIASPEDYEACSGEIWITDIPYHQFRFLQEYIRAFFGEQGSKWPT